MIFLLRKMQKLLCLFILIPLVLKADGTSKEKELLREKSAAEKCMNYIGIQHQYILHSWARSLLGVDDDSLFTDYYYTTEKKDDVRGVPIHYEQGPEAIQEKIFREINVDKDNPAKVGYLIEEKSIKIVITRAHPYTGSPPDPSGTMVTEYVIAADKTQLPLEQVENAIREMKVTEALKFVADLPGNDGKIPLVVKSKKRHFNGQHRDIDKTIYSQNTLKDTFELAAKSSEREASQDILIRHIAAIEKNTQGKSNTGLAKLASESPSTAESYLEDEVARLKANVAYVEEVKNKLKSCFQTEPGWQSAVRLRMRDDRDFQRYKLLSIDIIREILVNKNEEVKSGYIVGPIPENIPWNPEAVEGPLMPVKSTIHMENISK